MQAPPPPQQLENHRRRLPFSPRPPLRTFFRSLLQTYNTKPVLFPSPKRAITPLPGDLSLKKHDADAGAASAYAPQSHPVALQQHYAPIIFCITRQPSRLNIVYCTSTIILLRLPCSLSCSYCHPRRQRLHRRPRSTAGKPISPAMYAPLPRPYPNAACPGSPQPHARQGTIFPAS